ncbi:uncharacterized protein A4U43_C04F31760 [Asparagus officinalis]|uniref:Ribosomal protein L14 n=1 Tax=Asparagus officinalis TaxID=4686 RepID=A0A5P1F9Y9_ASPOF|nr:50S ribosomal protein HLP, mitochondrial-like [Asparagus officinalis]ONK73461.1 uncharacterized protein A4U43_C04F31760 [Asparagus officinalis]
MFAGFRRKGLAVGRSLMGGLSNNMLGAITTPLEISSRLSESNLFLQQHRTFIQMRTRGKVKSGEVHYAVVVRAAMQRGRCDGSEIKFDDNAVVLVNKQGEPIGTRVFGPVPHELRKKKHVKILTLAEHIA